jgi:glycosyltransferase involved in cell wall biosynthesis
MKISILTPNLSGNCLGRAYILAKALQNKYDVEIIGPIFGKGMWSPVANDKSIVYKTVGFDKSLRQLIKLKKLYKIIDGDIIYASKPLLTSFGIGIIKKLFTKKPLILDIDDWEAGLRKERYRKKGFIEKLKYFKKKLLKFKFFIFKKESIYWFVNILEKLVRIADKITVSGSFLKKKFGGTIIWHGRDENFFNPENYPKQSFRKKYKIKDNQKIIMFIGTPRPYKGVEDLIEAISINSNKHLLLFIIGIVNDKYCQNLLRFVKTKLKKSFVADGLQPFKKIPEFLSIADIIVIPQRKSYSTIGQIPAKVFDAMAMAKPIIATDVSDLHEILKGCGLIVEPNNPLKLSEAIDYLISNPEEATQMGQKARKRFEEKYSWSKMMENLFKVIEEIKE